MLREITLSSQECKYCGQSVRGRSDKKFCSSHCKNSFHNDKVKKQEKYKLGEIT